MRWHQHNLPIPTDLRQEDIWTLGIWNSVRFRPRRIEHNKSLQGCSRAGKAFRMREILPKQSRRLHAVTPPDAVTLRTICRVQQFMAKFKEIPNAIVGRFDFKRVALKHLPVVVHNVHEVAHCDRALFTAEHERHVVIDLRLHRVKVGQVEDVDNRTARGTIEVLHLEVGIVQQTRFIVECWKKQNLENKHLIE